MRSKMWFEPSSAGSKALKGTGLDFGRSRATSGSEPESGRDTGRAMGPNPPDGLLACEGTAGGRDELGLDIAIGLPSEWIAVGLVGREASAGAG